MGETHSNQCQVLEVSFWWHLSVPEFLPSKKKFDMKKISIENKIICAPRLVWRFSDDEVDKSRAWINSCINHLVMCSPMGVFQTLHHVLHIKLPAGDWKRRKCTESHNYSEKCNCTCIHTSRTCRIVRCYPFTFFEIKFLFLQSIQNNLLHIINYLSMLRDKTNLWFLHLHDFVFRNDISTNQNHLIGMRIFHWAI